jgi:CHAT domain-containing protein/Tfp pilus assembly protein PilF
MKTIVATFLMAVVLVVPTGAYGQQPESRFTGSDLERKVLEEFGQEGLDIYKALDGTRSLKEVLQESGMDQGRMVEMFRWYRKLAGLFNERALEFHNAKNIGKAIHYARLALEITEKVNGNEHGAVARSLNLLAEFYRQAKQNDEAERLYHRVMKLYEKKYGRKHEAVANSLAKIAHFYTSIGRLKGAESYYLDALEIFKALHGAEHESVVTMIFNIAILYDSMGRYSDAEPLYKEAIWLSRKVYGEGHPSVANGMNNLGLLYYSSGRYKEAEKLYKQALEVYKRVYGMEHPAVATAFNNLGLLYSATNRFGEAETHYKQALELDERLFGKDHLNLMSDINNLATLYKDVGRYQTAEDLYRRAIKIGVRSLGENHLTMATNYNNLALIYFLEGELSKAEPLYVKALEIGREKLGEEHPDVAEWTKNLALVYASEHKPVLSHRLFKKTMEIEYNKREDIFTLLPEEQRLAYMQRTEGSINAFITLTARYMKDDDQAVSDTLDAWLRWKGAVMETQQRYMDAVLKSGDSRTRRKFNELTKVRKKLARLKLSGPKNIGRTKYDNMLKGLENKKRKLETELSRLSKEFALEKTAGKASTKTISSLLPADSVYLDYASIIAYDFKERKPGSLRYFLFVLVPSEKPVVKLIELSPSGGINRHIKAYLEEIRSPYIFGDLPKRDVLDEEASALYDALISPIWQYIKGKKHVFVSPGGNLNLIPFEVIVTPEGKYLMEDFIISNVTAGRDIMRFADTTSTEKTAVLMADPDYDHRLKGKVSGPKGKGKVSSEVMAMSFPRIPDTMKEADEIEKILRNKFKFGVRYFKGKDAEEAKLFAVNSPRILHLATHGYFLDDIAGSGGEGGQATRGAASAATTDNTMLRSGIVLAGANTSISEGDDYGIVSADKALTLKLKGTELVVLSACDTGVGEVERGEGVFGLKRAFIIAGAKSLVMSLWSVPSKETTELMIKFYGLMAEGKGKAESLRSAKLELMRKYETPFFWGAFVLVGNPR